MLHENKHQICNELIQQRISEFTSDFDAISSIGTLVDVSSDLLREDGLKHSISEANKILLKDLESSQKAILYYYIGNAWAGLRTINHGDENNIWKWEQDEIENEIYNYRLSNLCQPKSYCEVCTNLGNVFSHVGRFIEAVNCWNMALKQNHLFGMALANKGYGLLSYANTLYDSGHRGVFYKFAYSFLVKGLDANDLHLDAKEYFKNIVSSLESKYDKKILCEPFEMNDYSLGRSKAEKAYRKWCLENNIFLNPLNDLGEYEIAARDIITCPSITQSVDNGSYFPPGIYAFYNQLKQEYVSARYFLYESIYNNGMHFSDKGVYQYNTLDYPCYGLNVEKAKIAYRVCYSLFDKMAFFFE